VYYKMLKDSKKRGWPPQVKREAQADEWRPE
jgi:hypothetical protein